MSYQVLALKYRPNNFDEVIGQNQITTTLSNAITSDRMAHAILFTGPRGTGKTTIARVLAKAMNCVHGPLVKPCNECKICKEIKSGHCADVFEIDGASNNSVDQIRELRDNIIYMPSLAKYKIYIIDEVHMLSSAAFNALLKTLEEPPGYVMFFFATTEAHKIPATILSRCQKHDLGRIPLPLICGHLDNLCQKEGFSVQKQSLELIAQKADGSIRDALSLLDRIFSLTGTSEIKHEKVLDGLGILDYQIMHNICSAILEKNGANIIESIENINDSGVDLKKFYSDLIVFFRNLNIIKICGKDSPAVNITDFEKKKIHDKISDISSDLINSILQILLNDEAFIKYSSHTKITIEMTLLKLLQINPQAHIDKIISNIDSLAKQISLKSFDKPAEKKEHKIQVDYKSQKTSKDSQTKPPNLISETISKPMSKSVSKIVSKPELKPDVISNFHNNLSDENHLSKTESKINKEQTELKTWENVSNKIKNDSPYLFHLLSKASIKEEPEKIIINIEKCSEFNKTRLKKKENDLNDLCKKTLNKELKIKIMQIEQKLDKKDTSENSKRLFALKHPLVIEAQKLFNAKIIN